VAEQLRPVLRFLRPAVLIDLALSATFGSVLIAAAIPIQVLFT